MGINLGTQKTNALEVGAQAGMYVSEKGSVAILPEQNENTDGGDYNGSPLHVLVTDIDNGRTFIKEIGKLKGTYTFKCSLEDLNLSCNDGCACDL